jgi:hypothetical protein
MLVLVPRLMLAAMLQSGNPASDCKGVPAAHAPTVRSSAFPLGRRFM